jgi:RND family efflux transporter MFP subunit
VGQSLQFSTEAIPGKTFTGRISFINPTADATSRSVKVQAEVPNGSGDLRPGLFVKGQINTGHQSESLQLPKTSLMSWDVGSGQAEVFLAEGEMARRRKIQTGRVNSEMVEVISGLNAGQPVISRGVFNVHDGERIKVVK